MHHSRKEKPGKDGSAYIFLVMKMPELIVKCIRPKKNNRQEQVIRSRLLSYQVKVKTDYNAVFVCLVSWLVFLFFFFAFH